MPDGVPLLEKILRAKLDDTLPNCVPTRNMHENFAHMADLLTLAMRTILPCEPHDRVCTLDSLENKMKPAWTLSGAAAAVKEWSYLLRRSQETCGTHPEPQKTCLSVSSLVSYLTTSVPEFSLWWYIMCRTMKMKERATLVKIKERASLLEPRPLQRGLEEEARSTYLKTGIARNTPSGPRPCSVSIAGQSLVCAAPSASPRRRIPFRIVSRSTCAARQEPTRPRPEGST